MSTCRFRGTGKDTSGLLDDRGCSDFVVDTGLLFGFGFDPLGAMATRGMAPKPWAELAPAVTARIRHRHAGAPVASWRRDDQRLVVQLTTPVDGVAPGQGLVLYAEDVVLGGGRIIASPDDC